MTRVINPPFQKGDSPMSRHLTVNLADVLERKYPSGFHVPADIDIGTFLEFADDDWDHPLDLDAGGTGTRRDREGEAERVRRAEGIPRAEAVGRAEPVRQA